MSENETICPEEQELIDAAAEEYFLFQEIEEIAADLETLTPEQLHAIKMLVTYFVNSVK